MKYVSISTTLLHALVAMAGHHVEDVESGVADGTYNAADNQDLPQKQQAVEQAQQILEVAEARFDPANARGTFYERLLEQFPELVEDGEIPGADMVDFVSLNLEPLRAETEARNEPRTSVQIAHWNASEATDSKPVMTHQMDIVDHRAAAGQVMVDIGVLEGHIDDILSVAAEINDNPLLGPDQGPEQGVQCLHIYAGSDDVTLSIFKIGDRLLLRPGDDEMKLERFVHSGGVLPQETFYWVD